LIVKIHNLFYGDNSSAAALRQMTFGTVNDDGHAYEFHLNRYFVS